MERATLPIRGVVFDLYGTLVDGWGVGEAERKGLELAEALQVPGEPFLIALEGSYHERMSGQLGETQQMLKSLCSAIGESPTEELLRQASILRHQQFLEVLSEPRPEVPALLQTLRRRGIRVGLISDCSSETPALWDQLSWAGPIEAQVFSWVAGHRKPHPGLYLELCRQLEVAPQEVVYVGDGGSHELSGAERVGMTARRIERRPRSGDQLLQYDGDQDWRGPSITSLTQVLQLLLPEATDSPPGWR